MNKKILEKLRETSPPELDARIAAEFDRIHGARVSRRRWMVGAGAAALALSGIALLRLLRPMANEPAPTLAQQPEPAATPATLPNTVAPEIEKLPTLAKADLPIVRRKRFLENLDILQKASELG